MIVQIDGVEYRVVFYYWGHRLVSPSDRFVRGTGCEIYRLTADSKRLVGSGRAVPYVKDCYRKATGRRLALRRALADAGFSKTQRTAIWKWYLGTHRWQTRPQVIRID